MFGGLRHPTLVRSYHQHDKVHASGTAEHVVDEFFMSWDVYDAGLRAVLEIQMGKTRLNGEPSGLFLRQSVRIDAGQGSDQLRFPVVHMSGSTNDHVFHKSTPRMVLAR